MVLEVPNNPKVYTGVYDNFKGVDFTTDPSNVYRRRSPNGKNMLPDLAGRPFKRKGWKIDIPKSTFLSLAGSSASSFTPDRIHHFSLGGESCMMIFNSLGVYFMSNETALMKCQLASSETNPTYSVFPPAVDGENLPADSGRSFFFEGKGGAGFYTFVGTKLFRFDIKLKAFLEEDPYVPNTLFACDKYGAGEYLEPVNLMTRKRMVSYQCDGESAIFVVPQGVKDNTAKVELLQEDGSWQVATEGTDYTISNGILSFTEIPPVVVQGEDNMRITYIPDGAYVVVNQGVEIQVGTVTSPVTLTAYAKRVKTRWRKQKITITFKKDSSATYGLGYDEDWGAWKKEEDDEDDTLTASFSLVNPVLQKPTFTPADGTYFSSAYNTKISFTPPKSAFDAATPTERTTYSLDATSNGYESMSFAIWKAQEEYHKTGKIPKSFYLWRHEVYTKTWTVPCTCSYLSYHTFSASEQKQLTTEAFDYITGVGEFINNDASAFTACERAFVYGSGLYNQVFFSSSTYQGYGSRVWYSAADDPTYVPDTNYIEAGGDDTRITGMMKVSGYVGIIKQGSALDASVYLAYPTSFDKEATFAVQQSINGVGAVSYGAFNILNAEPLFLSKEGVQGIEISEQEVDRKIRSRSYYVNKRLCAERDLEWAVSFVHKGLYYLCLNGHCYVLDGSQKTSWQNEKTNLQYECYYLENIPAQCFSSMGTDMYFTDNEGNLCRFKNDSDDNPYRDDYYTGDPDWTTSTSPSQGKIAITALTEYGTTTLGRKPVEKEKIRKGSSWYTVTSVDDTYAYVESGVAIDAVWDTIADDDGMVHFFKNLQKKGCLVSILPGEQTGTRVYLKADEKDPIEIGGASMSGGELPYEYYTKKKIKKYKRLRIICENDELDQGFGVDQIIKSYTVGNYSKNRR